MIKVFAESSKNKFETKFDILIILSVVESIFSDQCRVASLYLCRMNYISNVNNSGFGLQVESEGMLD